MTPMGRSRRTRGVAVAMVVAAGLVAGCTGEGTSGDASPSPSAPGSSPSPTSDVDPSPTAEPSGPDSSETDSGEPSSMGSLTESLTSPGAPRPDPSATLDSSDGSAPSGSGEPTGSAAAGGGVVSVDDGGTDREQRGRARDAVTETMGQHAAEAVAVFPSAASGPQMRRVWGLGPSALLACSGAGTIVWAAGPASTLADDDVLRCGRGVSTTEAQRGGKPPASDVRGVEEHRHHVLALQPDEGTRAWIGVLRPLSSAPADPELASDRAQVLEDLGPWPSTAMERAVVELPSEAGEPVSWDVNVETGEEYTLMAACRGEGEVNLMLDPAIRVDGGDRQPRRLACDGQDTASFMAYGSFSTRGITVEPHEGTRAVVGLQVVRVVQ